MNTLSLSGKRALVLGASSGIGEACAMALASQRASVTVLARNEAKLQALCSQLKVAGAMDAHAVACDMDDLTGFAGAIERIQKEQGPIHISVHNSGGPKSGPLLEKTEDDLLGTFRRHQLTAHLLVRLLVPGMRDAGYGRFLHVLSTAAKEPVPGLGLSSTVRAGMVGWIKAMADELPPGVTINGVLPGYVDTDRLKELEQAIGQRTGQAPAAVRKSWIDGIPEGRLARPDELGAVVLFLASPMASYIRGVCVPVEGGRMRSH
jgi:3-oxoacyl-[acyl-carrier protein] reductase